MGGTADQGVGRVGQGVEHVLADQPALSGLHKRLQQIVDHLGVHGPFETKRRLVEFSSIWPTFLRRCLREVSVVIIRSTAVIILRTERGKEPFMV